MKRFLLAFGFIALLAGCGGGGEDSDDSGSMEPVSVTVPVLWPERTREFEAAGGALSLRVRMYRPSSSNVVLDHIFERPVAPAQFLSNYRTPTFLQPGPYDLLAEYFSSPRSGGSRVGYARSGVTVLNDGTLGGPDGSPLGPVTSTGLIASILFTLASTPKAGTETFVAAQARLQDSTTVVLAQGAAACTQVVGSEFAETMPDCTVRMKKVGGPAVVRAQMGAFSGDVVIHVR